MLLNNSNIGPGMLSEETSETWISKSLERTTFVLTKITHGAKTKIFVRINIRKKHKTYA